MTSKSERLLFSRRRIITDIETQCKKITEYDENTAPAVIVGRKGILEKLFNEFENTKGWVGNEDYLKESSAIHALYCDACDHLSQLMPADAIAMHETIMIGRREPIMYENNNENFRNEPINPLIDEQPDNVDDAPVDQANGLFTNIKLPPLRIKAFTGDKLEWADFKSSCETAFHTIPNESTRFQYLKGHLNGEPSRLIRHLPIRIGSYAKAWEIRTKRYDNERAIINANLNRF